MVKKESVDEMIQKLKDEWKWLDDKVLDQMSLTDSESRLYAILPQSIAYLQDYSASLISQPDIQQRSRPVRVGR